MQIHVLSYNAVEFTLRTLRSVVATKPSDVDVVVLDNGSTQENLDWLMKSAPKVSVWHYGDQKYPYKSREHAIGSAKNQQMFSAHQAGHDALLLDNDVELKPGWYDALSFLMEKEPATAVWPLTTAPNHVPRPWRREWGWVRFPDLLCGAAVLVRTGVEARWPEDPVDYSGHPCRDQMPNFHGIDVEFGDRVRASGMEMMLPPEDLAVHLWQPGRTKGYS